MQRPAAWFHGKLAPLSLVLPDQRGDRSLVPRRGPRNLDSPELALTGGVAGFGACK
jgi:hypothetical protein